MTKLTETTMLNNKGKIYRRISL